MNARSTFSVVLMSALTSTLLFACAEAKAPAANAPAMDVRREPGSIEEAQADLARAKNDLDRSGAIASDGSSTSTTPSIAPVAPGTPPMQPAQPPADATGAQQNASGASPQPSPCEQACRALASMQRAKDAICRMAGESDARCATAEKSVADGAARASRCGCPH